MIDVTGVFLIRLTRWHHCIYAYWLTKQYQIGLTNMNCLDYFFLFFGITNKLALLGVERPLAVEDYRPMVIKLPDGGWRSEWQLLPRPVIAKSMSPPVIVSIRLLIRSTALSFLNPTAVHYSLMLALWKTVRLLQAVILLSAHDPTSYSLLALLPFLHPRAACLLEL